MTLIAHGTSSRADAPPPPFVAYFLERSPRVLAQRASVCVQVRVLGVGAVCCVLCGVRCVVSVRCGGAGVFASARRRSDAPNGQIRLPPRFGQSVFLFRVA